MKPANKYKLKRILPFVVIWTISGILYVIIEKGLMGDSKTYPSTGNIYEFGTSAFFTIFGTFIMGTVMGTIEITVLSRMFNRSSLGIKIILKSVTYIVSIVTFLVILTMVSNSIRMVQPVFSAVVYTSMKQFIFNFVFLSIVIYAGVFIVISLFVSEVTTNIGQNALQNFLIGKYHTPRQEERIFMFLDLKSSTTIAEKLGHIQYFKLLKRLFQDISPAIIKYSGEIYQYAGDEVIVSWDMNKGLKNANCIQCFKHVVTIMETNNSMYQKKYETTPSFKAGLHYGEVTTGEIGSLKKEIVFTGDVLNTTARIQGSCNQYGVNNLISDALKQRLPQDSGIKFKEIGMEELRGKSQKLLLHSVE
ncbi:MAG: adenylate/guanylate cyclase domain-containing protein [bacterium]|nr:adenylate/guanylate cyclase domain-containing protein [bacterium]